MSGQLDFLIGVNGMQVRQMRRILERLAGSVRIPQPHGSGYKCPICDAEFTSLMHAFQHGAHNDGCEWATARRWLEHNEVGL